MTVSSTTNRKSFTGDGVTTAFGTSPVVFFDETELQVYLVTTVTGASTLQTLTTNYTVSGGAGTTGTITMLVAPASTETLVILRVLPFTQTDDFINNDINDAEVLEDRLDKLTMLTQQLDEVDARALKLGEAETASAALTELPFDRASKFLAFDASKNMIASAGTTEVPVSAFMETVLDDTTAADAQTTLGGTTVGKAVFVATDAAAGRTALDAQQDVFTTRGDLVRAGVSGVAERVTLGSIGRVLKSDGTDAVWADEITTGAGAASTSGSAVNFGGIPAGVNEVVVYFVGVSTNGTDTPVIQLGTSGGLTTSGYVGGTGTMVNAAASAAVNHSGGVPIAGAVSAASVLHGMVTFRRYVVGGNTWVYSGSMGFSNAAGATSIGGYVPLSAELTQLSIVTSDTFDAGSINIAYKR